MYKIYEYTLKKFLGAAGTVEVWQFLARQSGVVRDCSCVEKTRVVEAKALFVVDK